MKNKAIEAKEKLGWSNKFIHNLFFTVNNINLKTKKTDEQSFAKNSETDDGPDEGGEGGSNPPDTCDCKYDWGCGWGSDCLGNESCEFDNSDCGFFGTSNCTGSCS